jgi:hypothetical protein
MRKLVFALVLVIVAASTAWSMPPKGRPYVEYLCDYFDENVGLISGCHHIQFSDLNGSLVEILD